MNLSTLQIAQFISLIAAGHTDAAAASELDMEPDEVLEAVLDDNSLAREYRIAKNKAKLKFERKVIDNGSPAQILQVLQIFASDDWAKVTVTREGGNHGNGKLREKVGDLDFDPPSYLGGRFAVTPKNADPPFEQGMLEGWEDVSDINLNDN